MGVMASFVVYGCCFYLPPAAAPCGATAFFCVCETLKAVSFLFIKKNALGCDNGSRRGMGEGFSMASSGLIDK
jgi:hypothetical protein